MKQTVLGIDISKKDFHVVLMTEDTSTKPKVFKNQPEGFESLQAWLSKQGVRSVHVCLEATSTYGEALAEFLYEAGHKVSVVNPSRIKGFAKSELIRTKTDQVDAAVILAEMGCVANYHSGRQLAAHAGLTPQEYASGCSVKGKSRLSHLGNARLRKALYMPAVVAMTHNPLLASFSQRLLNRGKVKMQVVGAVMRKLLHLAYGILKSQQPFDPNYLSSNTTACGG